MRRIYPDESPRHPEDRRYPFDGRQRWALWLILIAITVGVVVVAALLAV